MTMRRAAKSALGQLARIGGAPSRGVTLLIYHRVGGGTGDELDLRIDDFVAQLDRLAEGGHEVVSLDVALDRLDVGDDRPTVVLTFDDGFADVAEVVFPRLRDRGLPFTLYLAAGLVGGTMVWEGSKASSQGAPALTWDDVTKMHESGLCTIGNHTFAHSGPDEVDADELDRCSEAIQRHVGEAPTHFAWTWGVPVPSLMPAIRERFRSAATGTIGRNLPDADLHALRRVPVRASDPLSFFDAKLTGTLWPERVYGRAVSTAKSALRLAGRG